MYKKVYVALLIVFLVSIVGVVSLVMVRQRGLSTNQTFDLEQSEQITIKEKKRLRRITVQDEETGECLEITNDGVVRRYETCDGQLKDVTRLFDPKRIIFLFEYASRIDPNKFKEKPTVPYVKLILHTEDGSQIVYVPVTDEPESISELIDLIEGDLPQPTPTIVLPTSNPTPTVPGTTIVPTVTPSPTLFPGLTPTPVPTGVQQKFSCDYSDQPTDTRPYNVSNYICSTEPSPAP